MSYEASSMIQSLYNISSALAPPSHIQTLDFFDTQISSFPNTHFQTTEFQKLDQTINTNFTMSAEYKNTNVNEIAKKAEQDLNSQSAVHGHNAGLSSTFPSPQTNQSKHIN
jgi:hypothetical protein